MRHLVAMRIRYIVGFAVPIALGVLLLVAIHPAASPVSPPQVSKEPIGLADPVESPADVALTLAERQEVGAQAEISAIGLRGTQPVQVSCYLAEAPYSLVWRTPLSPDERILMRIPGDKLLRLALGESMQSPGQSQHARADNGETVQIVFDCRRFSTCVFRILDVPMEILRDRSILAAYLDLGITAPETDRFVRGKANDQRELEMTGPAGRLVSLFLDELRTVPLVDVDTGQDSFVVLDGGVYAVRPASDTLFVRATHDSLPLTEFGGYVTSIGILLPENGLLTLSGKALGDRDLFMFSRSRWSAVPSSTLVNGMINIVELESEPVGLHVSVSGAVANGLELVLTGPEAEGWSLSSWGDGDLRVRATTVRDNHARFSPLLPGHYSIRWRWGGRYSDPKQITVSSSRQTQISIESPNPRRVTVTIVGSNELMRWLGSKSLLVLKTPISSDVADATIETVLWREWNPESVTISPSAGMFVGLPVQIRQSNDDHVVLEIAPDASFLNINVEPAVGGVIRLTRRESSLPAALARDGQIRLLGRIGRKMEALIWERLGHELVFRGSLALSPGSREVHERFERGGHWVDLDTRGRSERLDLFLRERGISELVAVGTALVGRPARIWIADTVSELVLERQGRVVFQTAVTDGSRVVSYDSGVR